MRFRKKIKKKDISAEKLLPTDIFELGGMLVGVEAVKFPTTDSLMTLDLTILSPQKPYNRISNPNAYLRIHPRVVVTTIEN